MTFLPTLKSRFLLRIVFLISVILSGLYISVYYFPSNLKSTDQRLSSQSNPWSLKNPLNFSQQDPRWKAAFVTFVDNDRSSLTKLRFTIHNIEDRFNHAHGYPYIIFSNEVLSDEFKELTSSLASGDVTFEHLDSDMYGYANGTDLNKAAQARIDLKDVMFGDSEQYRFQSRFMAGMIFRHPALANIDYYWRFEAGTEYVCPIEFNPFQYMYDNKKKTSFSMALYEYQEAMPTLFETAIKFVKENPKIVKPVDSEEGLWDFIVDGGSKQFNRCHFWSNFQIADLSFYRSPEYEAFFNYLDKSGGFFYERWGDPVIHTLAAVLFLKKEEVHFWDDIGYRVADYFTHCPSDKEVYSRCSCRPSQNFDYDGYSCLRFFKSQP
ncbi:nucleotide-diphospho-sugar transferase [Spinellus fusiger]|nr:nucleotide-diphospho-sugar transferase [Spinellus fusiger]